MRIFIGYLLAQKKSIHPLVTNQGWGPTSEAWSLRSIAMWFYALARPQLMFVVMAKRQNKMLGWSAPISGNRLFYFETLIIELPNQSVYPVLVATSYRPQLQTPASRSYRADHTYHHFPLH